IVEGVPGGATHAGDDHVDSPRTPRHGRGGRGQYTAERLPSGPSTLVPLMPQLVIETSYEEIGTPGPPGGHRRRTDNRPAERLPGRPSRCVPFVPDLAVWARRENVDPTRRPRNSTRAGNESTWW